MKVARNYIGKYVEVVWRDPGVGNVKSRVTDKSDLPRGMMALATWRERGVLDDVTEGVIRIIHSVGTDAAYERDDRTEDYVCTWVPESLVESIVVYEPTLESGGGGGIPTERSSS